MKILRTIQELRSWRKNLADVGFVPTMGALHEGHESLIRRCRQECAVSVVSIFVNPTQFNEEKDLLTYPRNESRDLELLERLKVDAVFLPETNEIYNDGYRYSVQESLESRSLCGAHRPGHFNGVLTVVLKLFHLVQPHRVYFGEKDYQQLRLIQGMIKAFHLPIELIGVPTVRAPDGLALSSRNQLLSQEQRERAPRLYRILRESTSKEEAREKLEREGFKVEYVEEHWDRRLAAVRLGEVRLIDNVEI